MRSPWLHQQERVRTLRPIGKAQSHDAAQCSNGKLHVCAVLTSFHGFEYIYPHQAIQVHIPQIYLYNADRNESVQADDGT